MAVLQTHALRLKTSCGTEQVESSHSLGSKLPLVACHRMCRFAGIAADFAAGVAGVAGFEADVAVVAGELEDAGGPWP